MLVCAAVVCLSFALNLAGIDFLLPSGESAYFDSLAPIKPLEFAASYPDVPEPIYGPLPQLTLLAAQAPVLLPMLSSGQVAIDREAGTARIGSIGAATRLIRISRFFSALIGALAVGLLFLAAHRLFGLRAAAIGATLCALNPVHVYFSHTAGVTPQTTLWLAAAIWAASLDAVRPAVRSAALVGAFAALAAATKEYAAACAVGWGCVMLYDAARRRNAGATRLAAFTGAFVAIYLLANLLPVAPGILIDHLTYYRAGGSPEAGSGSFFWAFRNPILTILPVAGLTVAVIFEANLFAGIAALWGLGGAFSRVTARRALLAPVLGLFLLIQVPFAQILFQYVLPLNFVGLLAFGAVADRLWNDPRRFRHTVANVLVVLAAVSLLAQVAMLEADLKTDGRVEMHRWLKSNIPQGAEIWTFSPSESAPFDDLNVVPRLEAGQRTSKELQEIKPAAVIVDSAAAWQMIYRRDLFPEWPRFLARLASGRLGYVPAAHFYGWRLRDGNFFGIGQRYVVFVPKENTPSPDPQAVLDVAQAARQIFWRKQNWVWARPQNSTEDTPWEIIDALPPGAVINATVRDSSLWLLMENHEGPEVYRLPLDSEWIIRMPEGSIAFDEISPDAQGLSLIVNGEIWRLMD